MGVTCSNEASEAFCMITKRYRNELELDIQLLRKTATKEILILASSLWLYSKLRNDPKDKTLTAISYQISSLENVPGFEEGLCELMKDFPIMGSDEILAHQVYKLVESKVNFNTKIENYHEEIQAQDQLTIDCRALELSWALQLAMLSFYIAIDKTTWEEILPEYEKYRSCKQDLQSMACASLLWKPDCGALSLWLRDAI